MRLARVTRRPLFAASLLVFAGSALSRAPIQASTSIEAPSPPTTEVVQNIISQANIIVTVLATPTATMAQSSASLATSAEESLQFTTSATDLNPAGGLIISQEAVSVNVAPITNADVDGEESRSRGVIVVLAQYN